MGVRWLGRHAVASAIRSRPVGALRSLACSRLRALGPSTRLLVAFGVLMETVAAIFLGGGLGALARHFMNTFVMQIWHRDFPLGIMLVNILGSFTMGVLVGLFAHAWSAPQNIRAFLTVGILGGFTTFSSFSLDTIMLFERGQYAQAGLYLFVSVGVSLGALMLGMWLVRAVAVGNV